MNIRVWSLYLLVFLVFLLCGCSNTDSSSYYIFPQESPEALNHIISIDHEGNFIPLAPGQAVDENASIRYRKRFLRQQKKLAEKENIRQESLLEDPDNLYQQQLDQILAGIRQHPQKKILIFIHGGLNTLDYSISRAVKDYALIHDYYPVFINWHNGALDTYFGQAFDIRNGKPAPPSSYATGIPFIVTDLATAIINIPYSILVQLDHFYEGEINREAFRKPTGKNVFYTGKRKRNTVFQKLSEPFFPVKLVTAPLVDTLGGTSWNNMRRRVYSMFRKPAEFELGQKNLKLLPVLDDFFYVDYSLTKTERYYMERSGSGALAVFMDNLAGAITSRDPNNSLPLQEYEITLVGHSMGTIALNELIRSFPKVKYKEIVYLAAACSIRDFLNKTVPYLEKNPQTTFYNATLHPEAEDAETNMGGALPRGSLLAWIDSRYTHPETHLDRTLGRWSNVETAMHVFPKEVREQMYFKIFGFGKHEPLKHGDFTQAEPGHEYWNPKLWRQPEEETK